MHFKIGVGWGWVIQSDPRIMGPNTYELTKVNGSSPARKCLDQKGIRNYYIKTRKKMLFSVYKKNTLCYACNNEEQSPSQKNPKTQSVVSLMSRLSNNKQSFSPDYSGHTQIKEKTIIKAELYQKW